MEENGIVAEKQAEEKPFVEETLKKLSQELIVAGYSPKTREAYNIYVKDFLLLAKKKPEDVERADVITYLAELKEKRNAANNNFQRNSWRHPCNKSAGFFDRRQRLGLLSIRHCGKL